MVGGMIALLTMVGLIIDGGSAWAEQRIVQNGADAAAEAGAVVMGQQFAGATAPLGGWDAAISSAVDASAAANGITVAGKYYTDICGIPLKLDGSAALNGTSYDLPVAVRVGNGLGQQPAAVNTTPDCPSLTVGPAAGVLVVAHKDVRTYFANIIGLGTIGVTTQATAATGFLQESCSADQGDACTVLPIAIPVNVVSCDGSNRPVFPGGQYQADATTVYKIPLCSNDPGNVGWLSWTPPGGGTSELIQSIQIPNNPPILLPSWQLVTSTGNVNSSGVESAIRAYDGKIIKIPQFDLTCNPGPHQSPDQTKVSDATAHNGCLSAAINDLGGNGQNQWYRIPSFAHFQLCISTDPGCVAVGAQFGAYVNGNDRPVCDTGNGATSCLVGRFVSIESSGTIGPGVGGGGGTSKAVGVQLIK
jgi:Flp pilus assembly protein TadG